MKILIFIITGLLFSFSDPLRAEINSEKENMVKFKSDYFFGKGLQRILIIPQINLYGEEKVLRASGVGVIAGKEISKIEDLIPSVLKPVEPMLNPSIYQLYTLYKNEEFKESKHILWCEVEGKTVNLMVKDGDKLTYLRLPDKLSSLIVSNIVQKQFSFPPIK